MGNPVGTLETAGRFIDICAMNKHFPELKNQFSALSEPQDADEVPGFLPAPVVGGLKAHEEKGFRPAHFGCGLGAREDKGPKRQVQTRWGKRCEINSFEHKPSKKHELNHVGGDEFMELTIDSGAGENVMPEYMAPNFPVKHSPEQDAGVVYTAANGDTMPNRGRKVVRVTTTEGQQKAMNMQITDVNRALMSVARICDAGHTVVFKADGGVIKNNSSGEETKFRRENNVYRMTVRVNEADFGRQG